eukprot:TRINITY_DN5794_c0_g1_i1.p1 TRINITY_DN5794_c0_g1~~TRINITY_DN5794_c0_g1_i1.p1  ORF type:complete len:622 (-),score=87.78 TRINITY_DN5794_c0_g1_i1:57-1922(-)
MHLIVRALPLIHALAFLAVHSSARRLPDDGQQVPAFPQSIGAGVVGDAFKYDASIPNYAQTTPSSNFPAISAGVNFAAGPNPESSGVAGGAPLITGMPGMPSGDGAAFIGSVSPVAPSGGASFAPINFPLQSAMNVNGVDSVGSSVLNTAAVTSLPHDGAAMVGQASVSTDAQQFPVSFSQSASSIGQAPQGYFGPTNLDGMPFSVLQSDFAGASGLFTGTGSPDPAAGGAPAAVLPAPVGAAPAGVLPAPAALGAAPAAVLPAPAAGGAVQPSCDTNVRKLKEVCQRHPNTEKLKNHFKSIGFSDKMAHLVAHNDCEIDVRMHIFDNSAPEDPKTHTMPVYKTIKAEPKKCSPWGDMTRFLTTQLSDHSATHHFIKMHPPSALKETYKDAGEDEEDKFEAELSHSSPSQEPKAGIVGAVEVMSEELDKIQAEDRKHVKAIFLVHGAEFDASELINQMKVAANKHKFHAIVQVVGGKDATMKEYDNIDKAVPARYDVIAGLEQEAKQIADVKNTFLVYSPLLHYIRQRGTNVAMIQNLDRKKLGRKDAMDLVEAVLGDENDLPRDTPLDFYKAVVDKLDTVEDTVYDALNQRMTAPIDKDALRAFLGIPEESEAKIKLKEC